MHGKLKTSKNLFCYILDDQYIRDLLCHLRQRMK